MDPVAPAQRGSTSAVPSSRDAARDLKKDLERAYRRQARCDARDAVDRLFSDALMIGLALLLIPVLLTQVFLPITPACRWTLQFVDLAIYVVFVLEYVLKLALAEDRRRHALSPWHLLDLLIVLLPLADLCGVLFGGWANSSRLLRLFRLLRVAAIGSRTVQRNLGAPGAVTDQSGPAHPAMTIRVMDGTLENVRENLRLQDARTALQSPADTWMDVGSIADADVAALSEILGIPALILESKLTDETYPEIDHYGDYAVGFLRLHDVRLNPGEPHRFDVAQTGVVVICAGSNLVTLSRQETGLFGEVMAAARRQHQPGANPALAVLFVLIRHMLERDQRVIEALERMLAGLERIPSRELPPNFLEYTFHLKREAGQLVSGLLHTKDVLAALTTHRVPLHGFDEQQERIFDLLFDRAAYLCETAGNARENLASLIELYINSTSNDMNRVMKLIAVITCLAVIPTLVGGLLGMNLVDSPWVVRLWQVVLLVLSAMVAAGWVFWRLGWLRR